ncbi:MAG: protein of unknown function transrane [Thermoleophilia bacterium]|nr:protein of unknown function transrane [Thermoleophilia bacterium]
MPAPHREIHAPIGTGGWLRPFVLGAEDGIVSTAGLVIGVAATGAGATTLTTVGLAGLVSGALSMAAGEYVSVAAQRDTERSDIALEQWELDHDADQELEELVAIYRARGVTEGVARQVATELTEHDALGTHLREELAIDSRIIARPWQAAWLSAVSFAVGAALPVVAIVAAPTRLRITITMAVTLVVLGGAGALAARAGHSRIRQGVLRVAAGGALAMAVTWSVGRLLGVTL